MIGSGAGAPYPQNEEPLLRGSLRAVPNALLERVCAGESATAAGAALGVSKRTAARIVTASAKRGGSVRLPRHARAIYGTSGH